MRDLIVAGGGPAGLATALYARRAGLSVAVVERRAGPVDKACGEGLMPGALAALRDLGVDPHGAPIAGITYRDATSSVSARFSAGPGRGVRRTTLWTALRAAVEAAGAEVLEAPVGAVTQDDRGVRAAGLTARYLVAADGLHSPVRTALGLDRAVRGTRRFGLRRHAPLAPWTPFVEVHWAPAAEAYVTPLGSDLVGVAVLGDGGAFDLAPFPALRERLAGADLGPVRGAGPLRRRAAHVAAGRVLLVGDAAGYVDALTGEGIAVALAGARAAVRCLAADRPGDYERAWLAASRRPRALTAGLLWARRRPVLAPRIVPAAVALPRVFGAAVDALAG